MKRREFMISGLAALTGTFVSPSISLGQAGPQKQKITIVGAGLTGLVGGYELDKLGYDVTLLEAQMRPGGRVHTYRGFDEKSIFADIGAARIPRNHDLTLKYVREFNLPLIPFYPTDNKFVRVRGDRIEAVEWDKFADATSMFVSLDEPDEWQKIKGGNDLLPGAFASKLGSKIKYGVPVVRIERGATNVKVTFREGAGLQTLVSDLLLVAIPFTMLAKIEIVPAFADARMKAIRSLEYDSASRVFVETKSRYWLDQKLNGFGFGEDAAEIWNPTFGEPGTHGILQKYLRGGYSLDLMRQTEANRVDSTVGKLEKMFPGLRQNFIKGFSKCWSEDPWVLGAWAHPDGKTMELAGRPDGRLFFAGEHLSDHASWMQGAFESGLRAVQEIVSSSSRSTNQFSHRAHRVFS